MQLDVNYTAAAAPLVGQIDGRLHCEKSILTSNYGISPRCTWVQMQSTRSCLTGKSIFHADKRVSFAVKH
jgi:hypothetical protein